MMLTIQDRKNLVRRNQCSIRMIVALITFAAGVLGSVEALVNCLIGKRLFDFITVLNGVALVSLLVFSLMVAVRIREGKSYGSLQFTASRFDSIGNGTCFQSLRDIMGGQVPSTKCCLKVESTDWSINI